MTDQPAARSFGGPAAMPTGVRRVLDAMRAEPGRDLDLAALAAIAGTQPRTLQRQFRMFLGKSPLAALHDIRIECARRVLLRGSPNEKVTDVASRCGLPHLGRFSVEYRERYGERPSETLRRQAMLPAGRSSRPALLAFANDRPTVAVVPIDARDEDRAIGHGIADALGTALTRAGIAVTTDVRSARYQLVSSFRGDGRQARLSYRLMEVETGRHIWAHHSDGANEDAFLFEEHVATNVAAAIQPGLRSAEIARAKAKGETELTAYDLTLRALPYAMALDADGPSRALDLLERAMDADPDYALAVALAAWCHAQCLIHQFTTSPAEERERALALTKRAMNLSGDATVLAVLGGALSSVHNIETAGVVTGKALTLDGSSVWAWSRSGWIDVFRGRPEPAIERFVIALELAPHDPMAFNSLAGLGCAHFIAGRYADAIHWTERALAERPSAGWAYRVLSPAYVLAGRKSEAGPSLATMQRVYPDVTISQIVASMPLPQPALDRVANGLDSLGVAA